MKDNFQVETFEDKDRRDSRYAELRGRQGLVKLSIGEFVTVQEIHKFPGRAFPKIGKKGPRCGYTVGTVPVGISVPTWAIAYPRKLSTRKKQNNIILPTGPSAQRRQRLERFRRRHPHATDVKLKSRGPRGVRHALRMAAWIVQRGTF